MVSQSCKAVIACRARKDQKAKLTRLIRNGNKEVVTLAIGDGANDVEMIRAAHVGVGIIGKEGMQAVNNADYAIGQFRFLTRLLLVYGHRNYRGITMASLLIFYKNILFTLIQYLYTFICGLSGMYCVSLSSIGTRNQSYVAIFWYNTALTAFGPLILAIFDKDINDANCIRFPQLHRQGIDHRLFSVKRFLSYLCKAIYEACIIFIVLCTVFDTLDFPLGTIDVYIFGMVAVTINIFVANLSASIEQSIMFSISIICFWCTFLFWILLVISTSYSYSLNPDYYHAFDLLFTTPIFYLVFVLSTVLSVLPTMMYHALERELSPSLAQFIQDVQVRDADPEIVERSLEEMEEKRSLELELKTMRDVPRDVDIPELMQAIPEAVEKEMLEKSDAEEKSPMASTPYEWMKTGNVYRSIRSIAGLRALAICEQLHGPSYDSQSVNDATQAELISKINSHHWRSTAKPDLIGSLKSQLKEKSPVSILKKVSDSLKKEIAPRMILERTNKHGLSVVVEEEEEVGEAVQSSVKAEEQEETLTEISIEDASSSNAPSARSDSHAVHSAQLIPSDIQLTPSDIQLTPSDIQSSPIDTQLPPLGGVATQLDISLSVEGKVRSVEQDSTETTETTSIPDSNSEILQEFPDQASLDPLTKNIHN